jgi:hypothetical protein
LPVGTPGTPSVTTAVPNGGGGGIPGGGGGGTASMGGPSGGGAKLDHKTIEVGTGSAGAIGGTGSGKLQNGSEGGGWTGGHSGGLEDGLNLADYLPNGRLDPVKRGIAGSMDSSHQQIQPQSVDIWKRMSEHFRSRCNQGLLRDCGP